MAYTCVAVDFRSLTDVKNNIARLQQLPLVVKNFVFVVFGIHQPVKLLVISLFTSK